MENQYENPHLIDLYDEDDNKVTFEHLDTIQWKGTTYIICIPYDDEEEEVTEIVIFRINTENEEDCLEQVEDPVILDKVYTQFKERNQDLFEFEDE